MDYGIVADRGSPAVNTPVLTGATLNVDIDCSGFRGLTVLYRLRGTATIADMGVAVRPYLPDQVTLHNFGLPIPAANFNGPGVASGDVWAVQHYDLRGTKKVQARLVNSNAGTLNADISFLLGN